MKSMKVCMKGKSLKAKACSMCLKQNKTIPPRDTSGHSPNEWKFRSLTGLTGTNMKQLMFMFVAGEDVKWYSNGTAWLHVHKFLHRKSNAQWQKAEGRVCRRCLAATGHNGTFWCWNVLDCSGEHMVNIFVKTLKSALKWIYFIIYKLCHNNIVFFLKKDSVSCSIMDYIYF